MTLDSEAWDSWHGWEQKMHSLPLWPETWANKSQLSNFCSRNSGKKSNFSTNKEEGLNSKWKSQTLRLKWMGKQWHVKLYCISKFSSVITHPHILAFSRNVFTRQTDPDSFKYKFYYMHICPIHAYKKKILNILVFWINLRSTLKTLGQYWGVTQVTQFSATPTPQFFPLKELIIWWLVWTLHCKSSCMKLLPLLFEKHCFSTLNQITISWNQYHSEYATESISICTFLKYFF